MACDADAYIPENEAGPAVGAGTVEIGDGTCCHRTKDAGVGRLEVAAVALLDEGGGNSVAGASGDGAGAAIEVARILVEDAGEDGGSEEA